MTRLLNLGFRKLRDNMYVCEDIIVEVRDDDKVYIEHIGKEFTIDELEELMLAD